MGRLYAEGIAETGLPLEDQLRWHLRGNFFPPVPESMITPCVEAIQAAEEYDMEKLIRLPDGVGYKGLTAAPAWAIIEQHHLEPWLPEDDTLD